MSELFSMKILSEAKEMSQEMLSLAQTESWSEVAKIEAKRQKLLLGSLQSDGEINSTGALGKKIKEILEIDKKIQLAVESARNSIRDELLQLNQGKSQIKAYQVDI